MANTRRRRLRRLRKKHTVALQKVEQQFQMGRPATLDSVVRSGPGPFRNLIVWTK